MLTLTRLRCLQRSRRLHNTIVDRDGRRSRRRSNGVWSRRKPVAWMAEAWVVNNSDGRQEKAVRSLPSCLPLPLSRGLTDKTHGWSSAASTDSLSNGSTARSSWTRSIAKPMKSEMRERQRRRFMNAVISVLRTSSDTRRLIGLLGLRWRPARDCRHRDRAVLEGLVSECTVLGGGQKELAPTGEEFSQSLTEARRTCQYPSYPPSHRTSCPPPNLPFPGRDTASRLWSKAVE